MQLKLGKKNLDLSQPRVMGVLNVTHDSFSDGGQYHDFDTALRHAATMIDQGASIIDVGGESTRPGASEISLAEELDRVVPIIEALTSEFDTAISVDTSKPEVMRNAVAAGAVLINDVFALQQEGAMEAAAELDCAICLMHMQGVPRSMQSNPTYSDICAEVVALLNSRVVACETFGIDRVRLLVDPGFGFGKNDAHNIELLAKLEEIQSIGLPILVGWSRKRTLGNITGRAVEERLAAGLAAAVQAYERGANILRSHDVAATVDALAVAHAVRRATD